MTDQPTPPDPDEQAASETRDPVRIDHAQSVIHAAEDRRSAEEADRHPHQRGRDHAVGAAL